MGCSVSSWSKLVKRLSVPVLLPRLYLVVPIGSRNTVLSYINPTWGPLSFCMWTVGRGRCDAYPAKLRSFSENVFQQLLLKNILKSSNKFLQHKRCNVPKFVPLKCTVPCGRTVPRYPVLCLMDLGSNSLDSGFVIAVFALLQADATFLFS